MSSFLDLLFSLQNPEKTRNFNVFKNYSLKDFEDQIKRYIILLEKDSDYQPFRFSVVGTNGKGSTSFYMASLLQRVFPDKKIGLYTSPHLISVYERIVSNGNQITEAEADTIVNRLQNIDPTKLKDLSYFECLTLICFCFFKNQNCSYEVWEAGLGGRLDATKLTNPNVILLTKIGFDHSEILGDTLEKIVTEKIQIVGTNTRQIFSFPASGSLKKQIQTLADSLHLDLQFYPETNTSDYLKANFDFANWVLSELGLNPKKQFHSFSEFERPQGRLETISQNPHILFDPAHNPDAVRYTLNSVLKQDRWQSGAILVCGCLPDKDSQAIWEEIQKFTWHRLIFYEGEGFYPWSEKGNLVPGASFLSSPVELARVLEDSNHPVLALGSFRLYPILTTLYQNDVIL